MKCGNESWLDAWMYALTGGGVPLGWLAQAGPHPTPLLGGMETKETDRQLFGATGSRDCISNQPEETGDKDSPVSVEASFEWIQLV